ncbi:histidine phosphatase family protein [Marichromatium bheemlicum]|uniref:Histidine phosphatase family protein n=1 Tax=Marichromatium bheemlicum TaxID=365339 RepID=A0ABX1I6U0_9GAMM|nr:histidine phosphatase family protein [Marichromatium bheemlicum]
MLSLRGRLIDLLRHGDVEGGSRLRGNCDDPLSARGWSQLRAATAGLDEPQLVVSSPLQRCAAFARELAATRGLELVLEPALAERHFGDWEGCSASELPADELWRLWDDPLGFTPPGGEPMRDFLARTGAAWRSLCERGGPDTLVVTHGGVIRAILAEVLEMPPRAMILLEVAHAGRSRIRVPPSPGRPSLVTHRGP